jgi:hypothetical protein
MEHAELFLVDGLGLHKDAILHELQIFVELIPDDSPSLCPEFLVTTGVGSFLKTIGILVSESSPTRNLNSTTIEFWWSLL